MVNGAGYTAFNRHTLTVGDGPIAGPIDRGFAQGAYGSLSTPTYIGADGITYTIRALAAVAPQAVRVQISPRPPRTGADSILRAGLILGGQAHSFGDAFALDDTFGSAQSTTFTFSGIASLMPAIGTNHRSEHRRRHRPVAGSPGRQGRCHPGSTLSTGEPD